MTPSSEELESVFGRVAFGLGTPDPAAPLLRLLGLELVALEGVDPDRADSLAIVVLVLPRPHNAGSWHAVYVPEAPAVAMIEKAEPDPS